MLAVHQRIVDEWTILSIDYALVCEALYLGKVHILRCCFNGLHANVTANDLNIQIALDFPKVFHFTSKLFKFVCLVDRPVLKWIDLSELANWLF